MGNRYPIIEMNGNIRRHGDDCVPRGIHNGSSGSRLHKMWAFRVGFVATHRGHLETS